MRPPATWVRTTEASGTGTTGVSMAGFSALAPLAARAFVRLFRRGAAGCVAGGTIPSGEAGNGTASGWLLRAASGSGVGSASPESCAAVPAANFGVSAMAAVGLPVRGVSAAALAVAPFFRRLRPRGFSEVDSSFAMLTAPPSASGTASAAVANANVGNSASTFAGSFELATGVGGAAKSSARGTRPGSFRRPPRFTGTDFAITEDFLDAGRTAGIPLVVGSEPVVSSAASTACSSVRGRSPAASRNAFLRAVRFAPPRERRFFFFAPSRAASSLPVASTAAGSSWRISSATGITLISSAASSVATSRRDVSALCSLGAAAD